jgi:hypothetical protein
MKPQALQDAIKAQALARHKKIESGQWKEPVVKVHKVTADEMGKGPKAVQAPPSKPSMSFLPAVNPEIEGIKITLSDMVKELKQQKADIEMLKRENRELREMIGRGTGAPTPGSPGHSSVLTPSMTNYHPISAPSSPVSPKKAKPPAVLDPHTAKEIVEGQRTDKALRIFMKTKEGLYDPKYMSIRDESGAGSIVCFKRKVYIPENLRTKTIKHYKRYNENDSLALAAMRKNCCWPDMEKDFFA